MNLILVVCLFLQLPEGAKKVPLFQGKITIEPQDSIIKNFRYAPGDWIFVTAEAVEQTLVSTGTDNPVLALAQLLSPPQLTVSSIEISEYEGQVLSQTGDLKTIELTHFAPAGGLFSVIARNNSSEYRRIYNVKIFRVPSHDSLLAFDTRLTLTKIDTLIDPILDKSCYLEGGARPSPENFKVTTTVDKLVIIVTNEESFNALTSAVSMFSFVADIATGVPISGAVSNIVSTIPTGRDFGCRILYYNPSSQNVEEISPMTRTVFENRTIDIKKFNYYDWAVELDNSHDSMTSKQIRLQVYAVTLKPIYR